MDQNVNLRKLAVLRILKARNSKNASTKRSYRIPSINFEAVSYCDMIWQSKHMKNVDSEDARHVNPYTEPHVLAALSEDDLQTIVNEGRVPARSTYGLPCHNQRVERAIKLVTETYLNAAKKVDRKRI